MKTVGVGLIGCGGFGHKVAKDLLAANPRIEARAFCDPDPLAVGRVLQSLNPHARVYKDYRALCEDPRIDWVMIASWNCFHRDHAVAALESGKHVFCQKPLATTLEDCLAIRDSWRRSGRLFAIGFTMPFSPHYRAIRRLLDEGAAGEIVSFEFNETLGFMHGGMIMGNWRRLTGNAGTHLLEKCCHDVDMANWMIGARARRVASFGGLDFFLPRNKRHMERLGKNSQGIQAYATFPWRKAVNPFTGKKDIVDNQVAIIEYENGVRATLHVSLNAGIRERRIYILGTEGAIRADAESHAIEFARIGFGEKVRKIRVRSRGSHYGGDKAVARELGRTMLRGEPSRSGFEEGLKSAITCFAIDKAMETGRVVNVAPYWRRAGLG